MGEHASIKCIWETENWLLSRQKYWNLFSFHFDLNKKEHLQKWRHWIYEHVPQLYFHSIFWRAFIQLTDLKKSKHCYFDSSGKGPAITAFAKAERQKTYFLNNNKNIFAFTKNLENNIIATNMQKMLYLKVTSIFIFVQKEIANRNSKQTVTAI